MGWLSQGAARRRAEHYRALQQREWEASSVVPGVSDSRPRSREHAPVNGTHVLYIGGPWDGKRDIVHTAQSRVYVAVLEKVSDTKSGLETAPMEHKTVQYIKVNLTGNIVYFAAPDLDFDKHPVAEAIKRLVENYKAIS